MTQSLELYDFYKCKMLECDRHLETALATSSADTEHDPGQLPRARTRTKRFSTPSFDVRAALFGVLGVDLTEIHGMGPSLSLKLVGECGTDLRAANAANLSAIIEDPSSGLPEEARATLLVLIETKIRCDEQITKLNAKISRLAKENGVVRRLMTILGIGPLTATALVDLALRPDTFRKGRDFAAWLGLVPRQHSTGGKQRLGTTTTLSGHCVP